MTACDESVALSPEPSDGSLFNGGDGGGRGPIRLRFAAPFDFSTVPNAISLKAADLDRDGASELLILVGGHPPVTGSSLFILRHVGDGYPSAPEGVPGTDDVCAFAVGDWNHDRVPDLAIAGCTAGAGVSFLTNDGGGHFAPSGTRRPFDAIDASDMSAGDFDGDGQMDAMLLTQRQVVVFPRAGDAGPARPTISKSMPGSYQPAAAVGDLDRDGKDDIVVTGASGGFVFMGSKDGIQLLAGDNNGVKDGSSVALSDLDGDGHLDALVTARFGGGLLAWRGAGDGTFASFGPKVPAVPLVSDPHGVIAMDVDGDHVTDAIVATDAALTILRGASGGAFASPSLAPCVDLRFDGSSIMAGGDFDGDGHPDVAIQVGELFIFHGNGDGTVLTAPSFGSESHGVAAADVSGDGSPDSIATVRGGETVEVRLGDGKGSLGAPLSLPVGPIITDPSVADVNGDGRPDIVVGVATAGGASLALLTGVGGGTFAQARTVFSPRDFHDEFGASAHLLSNTIIGDFDGDGRPDLATALSSGDVIALAGRGDGSFATAVASPDRCGVPEFLAAGDVNGDGHLDVVVGCLVSAYLLLGRGAGHFGEPIDVGVPGGRPRPDIVDLNGDGAADLILGGAGGVYVRMSHGDGTFAPLTLIPSLDWPGQIVSADFDLDGKLDLAVSSGGDALVLRGDGKGAFDAGIGFGGSLGISTSLAVADFNRDGLPDLLLAATGLHLLINTSH